ncbi:unnamed protein product, partial [Amoebophrya sp. A120]|eukprot:GSA120T00024228001.1
MSCSDSSEDVDDLERELLYNEAATFSDFEDLFSVSSSGSSSSTSLGRGNDRSVLMPRPEMGNHATKRCLARTSTRRDGKKRSRAPGCKNEKDSSC